MAKINHCGTTYDHRQSWTIPANCWERELGFESIRIYWFNPSCCPHVDRHYWAGVNEGSETSMLRIHDDDWPQYDERIQSHQIKEKEKNSAPVHDRLCAIGEWTKQARRDPALLLKV